MHILILGGTRFLGRALVEAALAEGHEVTLFNRGKTNPDLFPEIERLIGERDGDLGALKGRRWDAVIDTCGYVPRIVEQSARLLASQVEHYTFISSLGIYADFSQIGLKESAKPSKLEDELVEEVDNQTYGPLKAACEVVVERVQPERALIVRPGLIVGPYDPTDRFSYWPWRVAQGSSVLAPGKPAREIQFIDVRDLSEWIVDVVSKGVTGQYNTNSSPGKWTMSDLLETCHDASNSDAELVWMDDAFLVEHEVGEWMEMPLWIPESDESMAGFFKFDVSKAEAAGLKFRHLLDTVNDTLAWLNERPSDQEWRAGMRSEREQELLRVWQDRSS
jgi:2'-hydroxyisoflavone reductase